MFRAVVLCLAPQAAATRAGGNSKLTRSGASAARVSSKRSSSNTAAATTKSRKDGNATAATAATTTAAAAAAAAAAATKAKSTTGKLHFDASKAGLQLVDAAHVERVIQEASRGTPFYLKEQRREEARRLKTDATLKKAAQYDKLSEAQKQAIRAKVDALEAELEAGRDLQRRYIHIDMDMFYAAVEEKKNPQLRSVPFGVGSLQMLATTNYIARQYGVRSGMPGFIGKKLCPELHIVPTDFAAYRREAAVVHSIAARYDPHFVNLGLDELTMDVTQHLTVYPRMTAAQIASEFRDEVHAKTQLTCSGGIAPTATLAKIASNVNKPNGQHEVVLKTREETLEYVRSIPLRKIPGIGYAQELTLNALGIRTCGDLLKKKYLLCFVFQPKTFTHYLATGLGLMEAHAHRHHEVRQSIGKERSFSEALPSREALQRLFRRLLEPCHAQVVKERLLAQQMRLILKYRTYDTEQFSLTLSQPTNDLKVLLEASRRLLQPHLDNFAEYRLVGVRLQKLIREGDAQASRARDDSDKDDAGSKMSSSSSSRDKASNKSSKTSNDKSSGKSSSGSSSSSEADKRSTSTPRGTRASSTASTTPRKSSTRVAVATASRRGSTR